MSHFHKTVRNTSSALKQWWWLLVLFTTISVAISLFLYSKTTPLYSAEARLEVNAPTVLNGQIFGRDTTEFITTLISVLRSQPLLEDIVEHEVVKGNNALYTRPSKLLQTQSQTQSSRHNQAIETVLDGLDVTQIDRSRVLSIRFSSTSPTLARDIPNLLADSVMTRLETRKSEEAQTARRDIDARLGLARKRLETSEQELASFNADIGLNNSSNTDPENLYKLQEQELLTLNAELTDSRLNFINQEQAFNFLNRGPESVFFQSQPAVKTLKARLSALKKEYVEKSEVFLPNYPDMLALQRRIDEIEADIARNYKAQLTEAQFTFQASRERQNTLSQRIDELKASIGNLQTNLSQYQNLYSAVSFQREAYEDLLLEHQKFLMAQQRTPSRLSLLDRAQLPLTPYTAQTQTLWVTPALLGFILGLFSILILTKLNNKIVSPDDLPERLNLKTIGIIPTFSSDKKIWEALKKPLGPVAEAYATACANLRHAGFGKDDFKCLQVTSTCPGEGKSATSFSLAKTFAGIGRKTILVDADLRLPSFKSAKDRVFSLSDYLAGEGFAADLIRGTFVENMSAIQVGDVPEDPSRLLASPRFSELIAYLKKEFDIIIIDSPPVLGLSDALDLSAHADATVFVVQSNALNAEAVRGSLLRLSQSTDNLMGGIMTKYQPRNDRNYYYTQYSYGSKSTEYGDPQKTKSRKKKSAGADTKELRSGKGLEIF